MGSLIMVRARAKLESFPAGSSESFALPSSLASGEGRFLSDLSEMKRATMSRKESCSKADSHPRG